MAEPVSPAAGDHVHDPGRQDALAQLPEAQARERSLIRGLHDHRVARGQRRRRLLGAEPEGMVEGVDLGHHTVGLAPGEVEVTREVGGCLALDLGDQTREEAQRVGRPVHVAHHADERVSGVHAVHETELVTVLVQPVGEAFQVSGAFEDRHPAPVRLEGGAARPYCAVHIGGGRGGNLTEVLAGGRIDGCEPAAVGGLLPLAADVESARREIQLGSCHLPSQGIGVCGRSRCTAPLRARRRRAARDGWRPSRTPRRAGRG